MKFEQVNQPAEQAAMHDAGRMQGIANESQGINGAQAFASIGRDSQGMVENGSLPEVSFVTGGPGATSPYDTEPTVPIQLPGITVLTGDPSKGECCTFTLPTL